jgi:hypothetical protein
MISEKMNPTLEPQRRRTLAIAWDRLITHKGRSICFLSSTVLWPRGRKALGAERTAFRGAHNDYNALSHFDSPSFCARVCFGEMTPKIRRQGGRLQQQPSFVGE